MSFDIIGDRKEGSRYDFFRDVMWLSDVKGEWWRKRIDRLLSTIMRKWIDGVENYAQYAIRRLNMYGLVVQLESKITPIPGGYELNLRFVVTGVREDIIRRRFGYLMRIAEDKDRSCTEYRSFTNQIRDRLGLGEELVEDIEEGALEQAGADSPPNGSG